MSDKKSELIFVRVTPTFASEIREWSEQYGSFSDVVREILEAAVDGRLKIKPNPSKPSMEKLYEI